MARTKGAKDEKPRKKQTGSIAIGKQKKKKGATMTAELKVGRSKRA